MRSKSHLLDCCKALADGPGQAPPDKPLEQHRFKIDQCFQPVQETRPVSVPLSNRRRRAGSAPAGNDRHLHGLRRRTDKCPKVRCSRERPSSGPAGMTVPARSRTFVDPSRWEPAARSCARPGRIRPNVETADSPCPTRTKSVISPSHGQDPRPAPHPP